MLNESPRVQKFKGDNSDALVRCGQSRSSIEVAVMAMERRGLAIHNLLHKTTCKGRTL